MVLEGEVTGEFENGETQTLKRNDVIIIPAGVRHKFTNCTNEKAVTFNTYSPPEY